MSVFWVALFIYLSSSNFMTRVSPEDYPSTKDCQVRLFQDPSETRLIPGETSVAIISRVEDVKAHPGQYGQGQVTNIRFIWYLQKMPTVNASIGFNNIQNYKIQISTQSLNGGTETLFIHAKDSDKSYEFIFQVAKASTSVFRFFEMALKNYLSSLLFREQRLRSAIINNGSLVLLPNEQVMMQIDGISNFSGDVAKIGSAMVTNLRFIWYSEIVSNFNVSIPLIILPQFKVSESKRFGRCFYLRLYSGGSKYMYGFLITPESKLDDFVRAAERIRQTAIARPVLTPPLALEKRIEVEAPPVQVEEEFDLEEADRALMYIPCTEGDVGPSGGVVFDKALGLSIESLPEGVTLHQKWNDASTTPLVVVDAL